MRGKSEAEAEKKLQVNKRGQISVAVQNYSLFSFFFFNFLNKRSKNIVHK